MFKKDKNSFFIRNYVRDVFSKETLIAEGKKAHIDLQTRRINLLLINHIIKKVESTKEKYLDLYGFLNDQLTFVYTLYNKRKENYSNFYLNLNIGNYLSFINPTTESINKCDNWIIRAHKEIKMAISDIESGNNINVNIESETYQCLLLLQDVVDVTIRFNDTFCGLLRHIVLMSSVTVSNQIVNITDEIKDANYDYWLGIYTSSSSDIDKALKKYKNIKQ